MAEFKVSLDYHLPNPARATGREPASRKGKTRKAIKHCQMSLVREYLCACLSSHALRGRLTITWDFPKAVLTPLLEGQGLIPRAHMAARA